MSVLGPQVERLEADFYALKELTGTILATLCVNLSRGSITTADDAEMWRVVRVWQKQCNELSGPAPVFTKLTDEPIAPNIT